MRKIATLMAAAALLVAIVACGSEEEQELLIAGIPDQDVSVLEERFNNLAEYLSEETGLNVRYVPQADYAAVVTSFKQGDLHLVWYGALTGVQARIAVPEADAIAHRARDGEFHSVFVAAPGSGISGLDDLRGKAVTFGSESSTSGHLMPRYYLSQAGVDTETELGDISFSGSHDLTWKLVEGGSFDAGALSEAVWERRVANGEVDTSKVDVFYRTPAYVNYHWVAHPSIGDVFGEDALDNITDALLTIDVDRGGQAKGIAESFNGERFVRTSNDRYQAIEDAAREFGIIE
ncbi:MAG: putative selenate ABC transporter substrate-binding protein [Chloroflexota bacterium]|nr:putative selenate ABC transporter substrate-binding protein [Chloroflexota bacterium]MDE2886052.1 putative selenate ABC transporter substrate-binding protein [Chloroflexota bacterium]